MMGVTALSLPSLIMLKQVVKTRLLAVFFGVVTVGIILIGYAFKYLWESVHLRSEDYPGKHHTRVKVFGLA